MKLMKQILNELIHIMHYEIHNKHMYYNSKSRMSNIIFSKKIINW